MKKLKNKKVKEDIQTICEKLSNIKDKNKISRKENPNQGNRNKAKTCSSRKVS